MNESDDFEDVQDARDAAIAAAEECVQRGFARKREHEGQVQYQMLALDDYVCPQCGDGWAGIAGRECENCALLVELRSGHGRGRSRCGTGVRGKWARSAS